MLEILAFITALIGIGIITTMLVQAMRGTVELLCLRNFFLLGFIVFQVTSAVLVMLLRDPGQYPVNEWNRSAFLYVFMMALFVVGFFGIYTAGFGMNGLARAIKIPPVHPGPKATLLLSYFFLITGGAMFPGVNVPYLGVIVIQIGAAFLAIAVALAGWAWVPRLTNPTIAMLSMTVVLGGLFLLFTSDGFGRRDMVGLAAAFVWGGYFSYWRYLGLKKVLMRFAVVGSLGMILLALITTTRFIEGRADLTAQQRISNLSRGNLGQGIIDVLSGQTAAGYSMYFIETRPSVHPWDTLHSLKYTFTFVVPRAVWAGKPDALALTSVDEVQTRDKPDGWNIGPGLVGHFANDNPFIALPLYTLLLAMFFKLMDSLLRIHAANPFVVVPLGVALGQVVALPRGELANFSVKMLAYLIGAWIAMRVAGRIVGMFVGQDQMLVDEEEWYDAEHEDDGDYDEYEYEYDDAYADYADDADAQLSRSE